MEQEENGVGEVGGVIAVDVAVFRGVTDLPPTCQLAERHRIGATLKELGEEVDDIGEVSVFITVAVVVGARRWPRNAQVPHTQAQNEYQ